MRKRFEDGFTLVELMLVVVIVAALSGIGLYFYKKHLKKSYITEAHGMLANIASRQELYYERNGVYCNASGSYAVGNFHPLLLSTGEPQAKAWDPATAGLTGWTNLNITVPGNNAIFGYIVVAGTAPTFALDTTATGLGIPAAPTGTTPPPWYYAIARGDMDGDATEYVTASMSSYRRKIIVTNEGE